MNRYKLTQAGVDPNEGIKRFNGKKDIYEKFLNNFPDDEHYAKMLEAIDVGDTEAAFQAAHALKGVTGTISLNELYQNLNPLVEELRNGSLDKVDELLPAIKESYDKVIEALK